MGRGVYAKQKLRGIHLIVCCARRTHTQHHAGGGGGGGRRKRGGGGGGAGGGGGGANAAFYSLPGQVRLEATKPTRLSPLFVKYIYIDHRPLTSFLI